jgi:Peptidase A4 family
MKKKTFANGIVITTYPIPPGSFDFEKATDDDRTLYGIPRFTAGSGDVKKRWLETMRNIRLVEPVFEQREVRPKKLPSLKPGHGTETSNIWSGGVTFPASGAKIWDVNGNWNIPKASLPAGAQSGIWYTASSWIGIDGDDGSGDVLQAGCDADVMISGGTTQYQFNPWWEWYPAGSFWIKNIPTSAGDQYTCWIQCLSLLSGSSPANSALIFLANTTTGLGFFYSATAPAKASLQGNCAEWIIEALETGPKSAPELAKYTTVDFTNCSAISVKDKTVLPDSGNTINMVNSSNQVISKGAFVGSNEVQVSYV